MGDQCLPYLSYPSFSINLWSVSAYFVIVKPLLSVPLEKPKFGREGATTWNAGPSGFSFSNGSNFVTSKNDPGPVQVSSTK